MSAVKYSLPEEAADFVSLFKTTLVKETTDFDIVYYMGTHSEKSNFVVKPYLLECDCSFVVTDPSGELYKRCGQALEDKGYKVKALNLIDKENSSHYNPFHYIYDRNGKLDLNKVNRIVHCFMSATNPHDNRDEYFSKTAELLIFAISSLLAENYPTQDCNFSNISKTINLLRFNEENPDEATAFDTLFEKLRKENPDSTAVITYDRFKQLRLMEKVAAAATAGNYLFDFCYKDIKAITDTDSLELDKLGEEKTALFIVLPVTEKEKKANGDFTSDLKYNYFASMLYSQLLSILFNPFGNKPPVHVRLFMNEFAEISKIDGLETSCVMRKNNVGITLIMNDINTLKNLYPERWGDIEGNTVSHFNMDEYGDITKISRNARLYNI